MHDSKLEHCRFCILCTYLRTTYMLTGPSFLATCSNLNASGIHHRSFPDLLPILLLVPNIWSVAECTCDTRAHTFLLDGPTSADAWTFCNDCQELQVSSEILETMFRYSHHRHLPSGPSLPLSVVSTSGTNQFLTIQKKFNNSLSVATSGPLPGLFP